MQEFGTIISVSHDGNYRKATDKIFELMVWWQIIKKGAKEYDIWKAY